MTLSITPTTLCVCRHIRAAHDSEDCGGRCVTFGCTCTKFQVGSRKSSSHYQRGQQTARRRVARLEVGDRILVGFPGETVYVRGLDGEIIWERHPGDVTSHPLTRHVDDHVLRPVESKTGALVATVTKRHWHHPRGWEIGTDLGELPVLPGARAVHVLTEPSPW